MHVFDGVLSTEVCLVTGAVAAAGVGLSLFKLRDAVADRVVPLTGMMAAVVFAGQMVNFPLGVPVSGHLLGGVLAAVVLGPWAGCLAMTVVLLVQKFLFNDGGFFALGPNILHMAVIGSMGGYAVYAVLRKVFGGGKRAMLSAAVAASWLSVMAAAALFCVEFRLSHAAGEYDFLNIFTLMISLHSAIGVGEALITGVIVGFVLLQRPALLEQPGTGGSRLAGLSQVTAAGFVAALAIAAFLAPFASQHPDGLNAVAQETGFAALEQPGGWTWLEDYSIPVPEGWQALSVSLAGVIGTAAVMLIAILLGRTVQPRSAIAGPDDAK